MANASLGKGHHLVHFLRHESSGVANRGGTDHPEYQARRGAA